MKRLTSLMIMFAICMMVMAQGKLTPQARLKIEKQKMKMERRASRLHVNGLSELPEDVQRVKLVVKVAEEDASQTFSQLRALGAKVLSKLGRQAVISIPVDSVGAVSQIKGILRIDSTHKGKLKTDVTMKETGVNKIDGTMPDSQIALTGKGITICVIDIGIDFQHPAFKDAEGRSRIKCVYLINDNGGHQFTVEDDEAGTIEYPGSVYDTPELIAQLTTDYADEYHGTHTTGIAAGSRVPQLGFGGMAPDADIVLIPFGYLDNIEESLGLDDDFYIETALAFASDYAKKNNLKMVLNGSVNSHDGPHDGTSTICEVIDAISQNVIPVFSTGNEGITPIHIHKDFNETDTLMYACLANYSEDESAEDPSMDGSLLSGIYGVSSDVLTNGETVSLQVVLRNMNTGRVTWTSPEYRFSATASPMVEEPEMLIIDSKSDSRLARYFEGSILLVGERNDNGKLELGVVIDGKSMTSVPFSVRVCSHDDLSIDLWDMSEMGFVTVSGNDYPRPDSNMSGGDWTSTDRVISVGAYCANKKSRSYTGLDDPDTEYINTLFLNQDIAFFSSYGEYTNGICQPTVCAPGTNIVSSINHYACGEEISSDMQWQGYPYASESGTSMSCPVVSGIIALWLQANPELTLENIKEVLEKSSSNDNYTARNPIRWGYGKIDAAAGVAYIQEHFPNSIQDISVTHKSDGKMYDLMGRRITKTPVHGIYIKDGRKYVR